MDRQQGKSFGRAELVAKLQEQGLSRRQAVRVINVILDCMISVLRRGEPVEFPFGWLGRLNLRYQKYGEYLDVSSP